MYPEELTTARRLLFEAFQQVGKDSINMLRTDQVLPLLCSVAIKQGANKQHIMNMLHDIEEQTQDTNVLRIIARCMVVLGEIEEACQLWMWIANSNQNGSFNREFSDLLRYVAIRAYQKGNSRYAARRLRESARWTNDEQRKKEMEGFANYLELQIATNRLLASQLLEDKVDFHDLGRYHVISLFIETYPQLQYALLTGQDSSIVKKEWKHVTTLHQDDFHLFHVLAVIYRERALASLTQKSHNQSFFVISTALWTLLLSTEVFWDYFLHRRRANKQGNNAELTSWQKDALRRDALHSLFSFHLNQAIQAYSEGDIYNTRVHLHCLNLCQKGATSLLQTLQVYGLIFKLDIKQEYIEAAAKLADKLLNEWYLSLIHAAEKQMQNQIPPQGLRKSYSIGINSLLSFMKVSNTNKQILTACLQWYNEYLRDLSAQEAYRVFNDVISEARVTAETLFQLAEKGKGYTPENQALSNYFVWQSLTGSESERIAALEEAIKWNPFNSFAQGILKEIQSKTIDDNYLDEDDDYPYGDDEDLLETPAEWENYF